MDQSKLSSYLHQTTIYLFYFLLLVVPLVWYPDLSELFEFPKMVFVYAMTVLIIGTWIARMIVEKQVLVRKSWFDIPIALFFISQLLSTLLSVDIHTSIFGYYSRFHGGLLSSISYFLLYYAFISNFDRNSTLKAIITTLVGALLASLYAIPEHFGRSISCLAVTSQLNVDCWIQDVQTRIFGTFGQPNWLAAYLITLLPLSWAFILIKSKTHKFISLLPYYLLPTTYYLTLLFTRSRSGLLGLAIGFAIFWALVLISHLRSKQIKLPPQYTIYNIRNSFLLVTCILSLVTLLFGSEYTPSLSKLLTKLNSQTTATTSATPALIQTGTILETGDLGLKTLSKGGTESGDIRKIVWQGALEVFKHHPLFGSGVETFAYSYYNYRPAAHNLVSEWDFLYNKAHNEFLNFLATTGIFGFVSYLGLILSFTLFILRYTIYDIRYTKDNTELSEPNHSITIALLSGYTALAVSNFFGFSTVGVGVLFFIFPAFALALTETTFPFYPSKLESTPFSHKQQKKLERHGQPTNQPLSNSQYIFIFTLLLATCYLLLACLNYLRADYYYNQGLKNSKLNLFNQSLTDFQKALKLNPSEATIHNDYSNTLSKAAAVQAYNDNNAEAIRLAQLAFQESATTLKLNSVHLNFYKTLAGVYIRLSDFDPSLLSVAHTILEDAISLAPTDAKLTYNLALIDLDQEATPSAKLLLEKSIALKSNYEDAHMKLGDVLMQEHQYQLAADQYRYVLDHIAPGNTKAKQQLESLSLPNK